MTDEFLTLEGLSDGYYMDRGSKFLAFAHPVQREEEAVRFLQSIRKEHPKARHFCTAMRLFPDASLERSNDDGEPSGSAGKPILGQLISHHLTNSFIVVVRYFGGTKLGVPGLIEAYRTSASNAIMNGTIIKRKIYATVRIDLAYEQLPLFINHCRRTGVRIFDERYNETPSIILGFTKSAVVDELKKTLQQYSQMDFDIPEDYARYMKITLEFLKEDIIV